MTVKLIYIVTALFALGAALILLRHKICTVSRIEKRNDWIKYIFYLLIYLSLVSVALAGKFALVLLIIVLGGIGSFEIYQNLNLETSKRLMVTLSAVILITVSVLHLYYMPDISWSDNFIIIITLVGSVDCFGQLWGRLVGRKKLCPRLSPGKTVEGFVGGILSCLIIGLILFKIAYNDIKPVLIVVLFAVAVSAASGDLIFSYFKRRLGIKDFSNLIPGHGGVLDRFDSLIAVAPVYYWVQRLIAN